MKSFRRGRGDDAITLFPFLAVLICTVGSLIVLLVVVVQQAKASADKAVATRRQAADEVAEQLRKMQIERENLQWQIDVMQQSRATTAQELANSRQVLSDVEQALRELRQQIQLAQQRARRLFDEDKETTWDTEAMEQLVQSLQDQMTAMQGDVERLRQEQQGREPSYAIVPYEGTHGTKRRPIFIECTEDRVILQPEGITLTGNDFSEPLTDDNPLAAALRSKREFLVQTLGARAGEPYPLLLVRPGGARAYAAARAAIESWDAEFGYELVDQDMKLAFPPAVDGVAKVMEEAIADARRIQSLRSHVASPRRYGSGNSPLLRASPTGGFYAPSSTDRGDSGQRLPGEPFGNRRGLSNGPGNDAPGGLAHAGTDSPRNSGPFGSAPGSFPDTPNGLPGGPSGASGPSDTVAGEPGSGPSGGLSGEPPGDGSDTGPYASGTRSGDSARFAADDRQPAMRGQRGPAGDGSSPAGSSQAGSSHAGSSHAGSSQAGSSQAGSSQAGSSQAGSSQAGSAQAGPSQTMSLQPTGQSMPNDVSRAGRDWGLPSRAVGATGITRPIQVHCYANQLVLLPEDRRARPIAIGLDGPMANQTERVLTHIWQRMNSWGIAGPGLYWKPILSVHVRAGGEARFRELAETLQGSGIEVRRWRAQGAN